MGNVALNAARYLVRALDMEPFASIEASRFSHAEGIFIRDKKVIPLQIPEYRFFFFRHPEGLNDLVVFVGDTQPLHPQGYSLTNLVIRVAKACGVQKLFTGAALACSISHMETPKVWGVATQESQWAELEAEGIQLLTDGNISGLNGLLLGVGQETGFQGTCLLGELPYYTIGTDNPKSSLAVLEKLCRLWSVEVEFSELREEALKKEMEIEEFIRRGENDTMMEEILKRGEADSEIPQ